MALDLRERFVPRDLPPRPSLVEDFRFEPKALPPLVVYELTHEEVDLTEVPLAVERRYVLTHGSDFLKLEFALCLDGFAAAVELLLRRAGAFQREPAPDAVIDLARASGIGDVGVAWPWGREERDGEAGFVRHNVVVWLSGRWDSLSEQARALDAALARHKTGDASAVPGGTVFAALGGERVLRVRAGGRLEFGAPDRPEARHFFIAHGGSVNRDPARDAGWYYRAGLARGTYTVEAFRVEGGLLPVRQTLRINIE